MMKGKGLSFANNLHALDAFGCDTGGGRSGNLGNDVFKRAAKLACPATADATADEGQLQITGANAVKWNKSWA